MRHGKTGTRLHRIWKGMNNRCNNPNNKNYNIYGGRGIKVCEDWRFDFLAFEEWALSNGYKESLSVDREDNDGNYNPYNCRWITQKEQTRNSNRAVKIKLNGEK